jgi:hypothetical protein
MRRFLLGLVFALAGCAGTVQPEVTVTYEQVIVTTVTRTESIQPGIVLQSEDENLAWLESFKVVLCDNVTNFAYYVEKGTDNMGDREFGIAVLYFGEAERIAEDTLNGLRDLPTAPSNYTRLQGIADDYFVAAYDMAHYAMKCAYEYNRGNSRTHWCDKATDAAHVLADKEELIMAELARISK